MGMGIYIIGRIGKSYEIGRASGEIKRRATDSIYSRMNYHAG